MRPTAHRPTPQRRLRRFGLAFVAVGCAAGYAAVVAGATAVTPFILFAAAVAVTATRGGFWPGALATGLAALVSDFLFLDPRHELTLGRGTAYLAAMYSAGVVGCLVASRTGEASRGPSPRRASRTGRHETASLRGAASGRG